MDYVQGVISCVAKSLVKEESDIQKEMKISMDLGADSLDFMDIVFQLESTFGMQLAVEDFDLISKCGYVRDQVVKGGNIPSEVRQNLRSWLPDLPMEGNLLASELFNYVTIETISKVLLDKKNKQV
jgi:acyl carrier protein